MAGESEEFGAGLDLAQQAAAQSAARVAQELAAKAAEKAAENVAVATGTAASIVPSQPDVWSQVRSKFDGLPEDLTFDSFADHVLALQAKADKAAEYERLLTERESASARFAADEAKKAQDAVNAAKAAQQAEQEFELPWKPVKVDPAFKHLCKVDAESGLYVPTNNASPAHIRAAEEMNARQAYAQQFVEAFIDDPVGVQELLGRKQVAALKKEFAEQLEQFKAQFTPIQEHVTRTREQQAQDAFVQANYEKLFDAEGKYTPLAEEVDYAMREYGATVEVALQKAEAKFAAKGLQFNGQPIGAATPGTPATPAKPISISKAKAAEAPAKPARFVDKLTPASRFAVEKPEAQTVNGKKHVTMVDLDKKYDIKSGY